MKRYKSIFVWILTGGLLLQAVFPKEFYAGDFLYRISEVKETSPDMGLSENNPITDRSSPSGQSDTGQGQSAARREPLIETKSTVRRESLTEQESVSGQESSTETESASGQGSSTGSESVSGREKSTGIESASGKEPSTETESTVRQESSTETETTAGQEQQLEEQSDMEDEKLSEEETPATEQGQEAPAKEEPETEQMQPEEKEPETEQKEPEEKKPEQKKHKDSKKKVTAEPETETGLSDQEESGAVEEGSLKGAADTSGTVFVNSWAKLKKAIGEDNATRICITDNLTANSVITVTRNVTIFPQHNNNKTWKITRESGRTCCLFDVQSRGTLTIEKSSVDDTTLKIRGYDPEKESGVEVKVPLVNVSGGTFILKAGTLSHNKNGNDGGAVCVEKGAFQMTDGLIEVCESQHGGGVKVREGGSFVMSGGTIQNCEAASWDKNHKIDSGNGGGVSCYGNFTMTGGTITGNNTQFGGGIQIDRGGKAEISGKAVVRGNSARHGGGIHVLATTLAFKGGTVTGNTASMGGGIFVSEGAVLNMTNGTLSDNTATMDKNEPGVSVTFGGGGIYQLKGAGTVTISGGVIAGNKAETSHGGGIASAGDLKINGGRFTGNSAISGGAVRMSGGGNITGGIFGGSAAGKNTASSSGAAVSISSQQVTISGGDFSYNECGEKVLGTIYSSSSGDLIFSGGKVHHNTGHGIYVNKADKSTGKAVITGGSNYANTKYGIYNAGICEIQGYVSIGFSSYTNIGSYQAAANGSGAVFNTGILTSYGLIAYSGDKACLMNKEQGDIKFYATGGKSNWIMAGSPDKIIYNENTMSVAAPSAAATYPDTLILDAANAAVGIWNDEKGTFAASGLNIAADQTVTETGRRTDGTNKHHIGVGIWNAGSVTLEGMSQVCYTKGNGVSNTGELKLKGNAKILECKGDGISNAGNLTVTETGASGVRICANGANGITNTAVAEKNVTLEGNLYLYSNAGYGIKNSGEIDSLKNVRMGVVSWISVNSFQDYTAGTVYAFNGAGGLYNSGTIRTAEGGVYEGGHMPGITNTKGSTFTQTGATAMTVLSVKVDRSALQTAGSSTAEMAECGILNAGTMTLSAVSVLGEAGCGIKNSGTLSISGKSLIDGSYKRAFVDNNIKAAMKRDTKDNRNFTSGIDNSGTLTLSGGSILYCGAGILNAEVGSLNITGGNIGANTGDGISNAGNLAVSGAVGSEVRIYLNGADGIINTATTKKNVTLAGNLYIYSNTKYGVENSGEIDSLKNIRIGVVYWDSVNSFQDYTAGTVYSFNGEGGLYNSGTVKTAEGGVYEGGHIPGITNTNGSTFTQTGTTEMTVLSVKVDRSKLQTAGNSTVEIAEYGILNDGIMTLSAVTVLGEAGCGIKNSGTLTVGGNSHIDGSYRRQYDANITKAAMKRDTENNRNFTTGIGNSGTLNLSGGTICYCTNGIRNEGTLNVKGGMITAVAAAGVSNSGTMTMSYGTISSNPTGIENLARASATMSGGTVNRNGTGINNAGTLYVKGGMISSNTTGIDNPAAASATLSSGTVGLNGTGVDNAGTFTMNGGSIKDSTKHGVYQAGTFRMSGAAVIDAARATNDVCLLPDKVITVTGDLTASGVVAKLTPVGFSAGVYKELKKVLPEDETVSDTTQYKKAMKEKGLGRIVVKAAYYTRKGSDILFYGADRSGSRFVLTNGGVLRPGDYLDSTALAGEKTDGIITGNISEKDVVISNSYQVQYEKNLKDENGKTIITKISDIPQTQTKFWCETLLLPNGTNSVRHPSIADTAYAHYIFARWEGIVRSGNKDITIAFPDTFRYTHNRSIVLYAQWQSGFNIAYIGNEQDKGEDFKQNDIRMTSDYTFHDNMDVDGTKHFEKEIVHTFTDAETGETISQETTATVVGWSFDKGQQNRVYNISSEIGASDLYAEAKGKEGAITVGAPASDFGAYPQTTPLLAQLNGGVAVHSIPAGSQRYVNLYAVWDEGPSIEAYDLYYTLEEAQSTSATDGITEAELLRWAKAEDEEDGSLTAGMDISIGAGKKTSFYVSDYTAEDFTSLTASGSVSINYRAVDSAGNITDHMVVVHITDTTPKDANTGRVRFISKEHLDTLGENSVWRKDAEYRGELTAVLGNEKKNVETAEADAFGTVYIFEKPGSGEWETPPEQTWVFTHDQVLEVQDYIEAHGIGNIREAGALAGFAAQFAACRQ